MLEYILIASLGRAYTSIVSLRRAVASSRGSRELKLLLNLLLIPPFLLILSGCAGKTNQSKKFLSNIETHLKKNHHIEHGAIIATYDLAGLGNSKCLHARDFGLIINDPRQNSRFIKQASGKIKEPRLEQRAKMKLAALKYNLALLHDKYAIFNSSDARKLDLHEINANEEIDPFDNIEVTKESGGHLNELNKIDHIVRHVPIFAPQSSARLTSKFGMRKHPVKGVTKFHAGTDFAGPKTSPIYASAYGRVASVERVGGYGNTIVIEHGKGFKTRYAHLSKILVKKGDDIIRGQEIGLQGKTGAATAEHLHFEVIFNNKHVNPADFVLKSYSCKL